MPPLPSTDVPKNQYQHYIPRFILRSFQDAQIRQRSKKQRQKDFHKARRTGVDVDSITVFDSKTQVLEARPISKEYGVVNMYRDARNPANVDHLEQGLSKLEASAAKSIKGIHSALESGKRQVQMLRKELEVIRKFVYIMHYRRVSLISSWFDENDPDNRSMREVYRVFRQKHDLTGKDDLWLWGLKYFLDTPHHQIVGMGIKIQKKQYGGEEGMLNLLLNKVDPNLENFHAVDYTSMAEDYFLAIWEAADGEEFVLGSNSFGLFEGTIWGAPGLHRIFVVSPRVALILRSITLSPQHGIMQSQKGKQSISSQLVDIPTPRPKNLYAGYVMQANLTAEEALGAYRLTPIAQEDKYIFTPTKLTPKQTHNLNFFILSHLDMGTLTFSSRPALTRSLKNQLSATISYTEESKYNLRALLGIIASNPSDEEDQASSRPLAIDLIIRSIANGTIEFNSNYDRAYRVYHAATDDIEKYCSTTAEIHAITARAIVQMKALLPPLPTIYRHMDFSFLKRNIVKKLPKEDSELFFALVGDQVDVLKVGRPSGSDIVEQIKYEAAIIGFAHWLAEYRSSVLKELMPHPLVIMV